MKNLDKLIKEELNKYVYEIKEYDIYDIRYTTDDINSVREQVFNIFIDRLLNAKGFKRTKEFSELLSYLSNDCWGYLNYYHDNINGFATMLNNSSTIIEFSNILSDKHRIIVEYLDDLRNSYLYTMRYNYFIKVDGKVVDGESQHIFDSFSKSEIIEYENIFDLLYDVLIEIEVVRLNNKPINELKNEISGFLSEFGIRIENDVSVDKEVFVYDNISTNAFEDVTSSKLSRVVRLMAFCNTYEDILQRIKDECVINTINDLLNVTELDTSDDLDTLIKNEKSYERYR